jgi:hypothetical protein
LPTALERSLASLDDYRAGFDRVPESFTNTILLGSLIVPVGLLRRRRREEWSAGRAGRPAGVTLGALPLARRDLEQLEHAVALQPRLVDPDNLTPRAQRGLMHRLAFRDALTWMTIHGETPETVARWQSLLQDARRPEPLEAGRDLPDEHEEAPRRPQRRRRRRRRRAPAPHERG